MLFILCIIFIINGYLNKDSYDKKFKKKNKKTKYNPYGDEIRVPNMNCEDWQSLSLWLRELKTETIWTLRQIIDEYQKTNPKIRWFNNKLCDEGQNRSQKLEEE